MKGNNREIQRQMIEDEIIAKIDRQRRFKTAPLRKKGFISLFEYLKYTQPDVAWKFGKMTSAV